MTTTDYPTRPRERPAAPAGNGHHGNGHRSGERRDELAAFLRARRARISPADVGLPPGLRRRTPGLRREEVAQLAGVGVTWYTWLEQGRPIHASSQVLDAVASALRLDHAEQEHLYRLAGAPAPSVGASTTTTVSPAVREILNSLDPLPAMLLNSRYDVLAVNQARKDLTRGWHADPCRHDNLLWCCFTEPAARRVLVNYEEEMTHTVANLRASFAHHLNEPAWTEFIRRLSAASPAFAALWARHDVAGPTTHLKRFMDPRVGLLRLRATSLAVTDMPETRILVYSPADEETRERLTRTRGTEPAVEPLAELAAEPAG